MTLSIVIVCDYDGGQLKGWSDLRKTLTALAAQDLSQVDEVLVPENASALRTAPSDLLKLLPCLRAVPDSATGSYELKNAGVRAATSEWVAVLDADCTPQSDWVERIHRAIRGRPD